MNISTELTVGSVIALLSLAMAILAYRRGSKADKKAQENAATSSVYAGYDRLLKSLQDDNANLRHRVVVLEQELADAKLNITNLQREIGKG